MSISQQPTTLALLRSEIPSGKCAKLHTVAASHNEDHMPWSLYYCLFAPHIYGCYSSRTSRSLWIAHLTPTERLQQHRGLNWKLLRLLPGRHMVRMIMELVGNRSFTLTTSNGKRSRLRRRKNGVPQESVFASLIFNITSDLSITVSNKYAYPGDLSIVHTDVDWQAVKWVLRVYW